jgi:phosphopantothenoylcysteine decarboxylase/phosphopantothenate--cysteine ligase
VITAGPTREHLDDVRFLSNASTGRMGCELARAAARRGARVTLVIGPTALKPPAGVRSVSVISTQEMLAAARVAAAGADLVIFAAAPSDWRPSPRLRGKPPREAGPFDLRLNPTPDIAATLARGKGDRVHVGFALEVGRGEARAREKMARKRLDAIVLNGVENVGTGGGHAAWLVADEQAVPLSTASKARLAGSLLRCIEPLLLDRE